MSSDHIGVRIAGVDELNALLESIGTIGTKQAFGNALRKSVKPIADEANQLAPVDDSSTRPAGAPRLRGSYIVRSRLSKSQMRKRGGRRHAVEVFVGSSAPHAVLDEFGHMIVTKGSKRVVGHVAARPTLRTAFDMHARAANRTFFRLIGQEIERVARRFRRQAERGKLSKGARQAFRVPM